jgi:hypothetical protein
MMADQECVDPLYEGGNSRTLRSVGAWFMLIGGFACWLFAELLLVESEVHVMSNSEFLWWLAVALFIGIVISIAVFGSVFLGALRAFRERLDNKEFLVRSASCLGIGVVEIVLAVVTLIVVFIVLSGNSIPTVHVP